MDDEKRFLPRRRLKERLVIRLEIQERPATTTRRRRTTSSRGKKVLSHPLGVRRDLIAKLQGGSKREEEEEAKEEEEG